MRSLIIIVLIVILVATTRSLAYADYVVKDGNGHLITIKSISVGSSQLPQSSITDTNGNSVNNSNPLPSQPPGSAGTDLSANAPSLSGLTLLKTANAYSRVALYVGANCLAGIFVVLDDQAGKSNFYYNSYIRAWNSNNLSYGTCSFL